MASCSNSSVPITIGNGTPIPVIPSVSGKVTHSLTICYLGMYCILFISVYVQLWLILVYNYKRFSFQTVFLFLCAFWSALRATLFSFYFKDTIAANELSLFPYWLLYCFPVCLQFFTLCLLTLYFAQVCICCYIVSQQIIFFINCFLLLLFIGDVQSKTQVCCKSK